MESWAKLHNKVNDREVWDLLVFLKNMTPVEPLQPSSCIYVTARNNAITQATTGKLEHVDQHGTTIWERLKKGCKGDMVEWYKEKNKNGEFGGAATENISWQGIRHGDGGKPKPEEFMTPREVNIELLIDEREIDKLHRRAIVLYASTHVAAFTYADVVFRNGEKFYGVRWLQNFGVRKGSKYAADV